MYFDHAIPSRPPKGCLPGQTTPARLLRRLTPTGVPAALSRASSQDGNVRAETLWVTDGCLAVTASVGDTGYTEEQLRQHCGTYAYCVSQLLVDGVVVTHPMVWAAYAASPWVKRWLVTERLPLYRCMNMRGFRAMLANWPKFNGGWTYAPDMVTFAMAHPDRMEAPYLDEPDWYLSEANWPQIQRRSAASV